ncbi:hypothetical protein TEA_021039 [Camellia sinensis var. sinensis]|uniref:PGG domain-containing protein n=1 Tax=Camellia sinensis var. sinensis TaxID=542762 RepID=A0A4S4E6Y2_CAMSN|nr:hypothetical protein TEA_021039 [Camellia sinensis var. sinensis]
MGGRGLFLMLTGRWLLWRDKDVDPIGDDDIENLRGKALSGVPATNLATLGGSFSERSKWKLKSVVTLALTLLTSSQAILIVWSKRAGKYEYSVTTANFSVYSTSVAMLLTAVVSVFLFGFHLSLPFFLGSTPAMFMTCFGTNFFFSPVIMMEAALCLSRYIYTPLGSCKDSEDLLSSNLLSSNQIALSM